MKPKYSYIIIAIILIIALFTMDNTANAKKGDKEILELPLGTQINLVMLEQILSNRNRPGDEVIFAVTEDIIVDGTVLIVEGTPAIGRVMNADAANSSGDGSINIILTGVVPLYCTAIELIGDWEFEGNRNQQGQILRDEWNYRSPAAELGLSMERGERIKIEAGLQLSSFAMCNAEIESITLEEMRLLVDNWYVEKVIQCFRRYHWDGVDSIEEVLYDLEISMEPELFTVTAMDDHYYTIDLDLGTGEIASFSLKSFEEPHDEKFITLEALNEPAGEIVTALKDS